MKATLTLANGKTYEADTVATNGKGDSVLMLDGMAHNAFFVNTQPIPPMVKVPDTATVYLVAGATKIGDVGQAGEGIEYARIIRQESGEALIEFHYKTVKGPSPCALVVNGVFKGQMEFNNSHRPTISSRITALRQGENTIRLVAMDRLGMPELDTLTVSSVTADSKTGLENRTRKSDLRIGLENRT